MCDCDHGTDVTIKTTVDAETDLSQRLVGVNTDDSFNKNVRKCVHFNEEVEIFLIHLDKNYCH